jgi:CMP/dCMP kinase
MAAITLSRQLGSLGNEVAHAAAQRLGYRLAYRDLINQAALRAGAPEMALSVIDDLGLLDIQASASARQAYLQAVGQVVEELADQGDALIVGRAGCILLAGRPDILHVRLIAPLECRVCRIAAQHTISLEAARARVEASDLARHGYLQTHYEVDWNDGRLYDLVINTEKLTGEAACDLICLAHAYSLAGRKGISATEQELGLE